MKGKHHCGPTDAELDALSLDGPVVALAPVGGGSGGVVDGELKKRMLNIVGRILGQNGNPATAEEREVLEYHRKMVDVGVGGTRVAKSSLVGLGSKAGEGTLEECLNRVYVEVRQRMRNAVSDDDCYKLAASKLSGMNSAKIMIQREGRLHLVERVLASVGGGDAAVNAVASAQVGHITHFIHP